MGTREKTLSVKELGKLHLKITYTRMHIFLDEQFEKIALVN